MGMLGISKVNIVNASLVIIFLLKSPVPPKRGGGAYLLS